jgi:hypothetical protein
VPQRRLHRVAVSSGNVVRRHSDNPVIAAVGETLLPAAELFVTAHTALEVARTTQTALVAESAAATEALDRTLSAWLGPLGRDVPGFDATAYGQNPEVTLEVIADGRRLLEVVQAHESSLTYAEQLVQALRSAIEVAEAAHTRAQDARIELQRKQAEVRKLAVALQRHLIALRRAVRVELGSRHHDYQRLRVSRGRADAPEVDEDAIEIDDTDAAAANATEIAQPVTAPTSAVSSAPTAPPSPAPERPLNGHALQAAE